VTWVIITLKIAPMIQGVERMDASIPHRVL